MTRNWHWRKYHSAAPTLKGPLHTLPQQSAVAYQHCTHTNTITHSHSFSFSLSHTHTCSRSLSLSLSQTYSLTLSTFLSLIHCNIFPTYSLSPTLSFTRTLLYLSTHTLYPPLFVSNTQTQSPLQHFSDGSVVHFCIHCIPLPQKISRLVFDPSQVCDPCSYYQLSMPPTPQTPGSPLLSFTVFYSQISALS